MSRHKSSAVPNGKPVGLRELFLELSDVPGEIRDRLTRCACLPSDLKHVAEAMEGALDDIAASTDYDSLCAAAIRLRAQVDLGLHIVSALGTLTGEVSGLAWAAAILRPGIENSHGNPSETDKEHHQGRVSS